MSVKVVSQLTVRELHDSFVGKAFDKVPGSAIVQAVIVPLNVRVALDPVEGAY